MTHDTQKIAKTMEATQAVVDRLIEHMPASVARSGLSFGMQCLVKSEVDDGEMVPMHKSTLTLMSLLLIRECAKRLLICDSAS